jgi:hypothetical protein
MSIQKLKTEIAFSIKDNMLTAGELYRLRQAIGNRQSPEEHEYLVQLGKDVFETKQVGTENVYVSEGLQSDLDTQPQSAIEHAADATADMVMRPWYWCVGIGSRFGFPGLMVGGIVGIVPSIVLAPLTAPIGFFKGLLED